MPPTKRAKPDCCEVCRGIDITCQSCNAGRPHKRITRSAAAASQQSSPISNVHINPVQKVFIAIDIGTQDVKAAYTVRRVNEEPKKILRDNLLKQFFLPGWPCGAHDCPAQLAWVSSEEGPRWGAAVSLALEKGDIKEGDIFRWIKATMLNSGSDTAESFHGSRLTARIAEQSLRINDNVGPFELWVLLQKVAFDHILKDVWAAYLTALQWPAPVDGDDISYQETITRSILSHTDFEVALCVPAGLSVEKCKLVVEAAHKAGIPDCYLVAEPACAATYLAQLDGEDPGNVPDPRATCIVDIGCGTVDLTMCSVVPIDPRQVNSAGLQLGEGYCLQELTPGTMRWCGAGLIDSSFRRIAEEELDMASLTAQMNETATDPNWTVQTTLDYLEHQFGVRKIHFDNDVEREVTLFVPREFWHESNSMSARNGRLIVKNQTVKALFAQCIRQIMVLIDAQITSLIAGSTAKKGSIPHASELIKQIVLVGGGGASPYIRKVLERHYSDQVHDLDIGCLPPKHRLEVRRRIPTDRIVNMTVLGALLLLLDKPFVGTRIARRGYCFSWDEETTQRRQFGADHVEYNPTTGTYMSTDVSAFFLKMGQPVGPDFEFISNIGTRALHTAPERRNGREQGNEKGWSLSEFLLYTDRKRSCRNNLWVLDDKYEIHEDREIVFHVSNQDATHFAVKTDTDEAEYKHLEYRIKVTIRNFIMRFELIIPRSGTFQDMTKGTFGVTQQCDTQHIYELYSSSTSDRLG